jgi:hypothetical protein
MSAWSAPLGKISIAHIGLNTIFVLCTGNPSMISEQT